MKISTEDGNNRQLSKESWELFILCRSIGLLPSPNSWKICKKMKHPEDVRGCSI